jgi:pimeloyl-ACP methyl ester carboxylesterase
MSALIGRMPLLHPTVASLPQFATAFGERGLRSSRPPHAPFAEPGVLAAVRTPVFMLCGDKDKMCPPQVSARSALESK